MDEQKKIEFKPSFDQLAFSTAFVRNFGNIKKSCREIGDKSRNKYYKWIRDKEFQAWLQHFTEECVLRQYGTLILACLHFALKGSYRHAELILTMCGKYSPRGINIKNALINQVKDGNIIIGNATREFLSAIAQATGNLEETEK
jgi:hypothetical protein